MSGQVSTDGEATPGAGTREEALLFRDLRRGSHERGRFRGQAYGVFVFATHPGGQPVSMEVLWRPQWDVFTSVFAALAGMSYDAFNEACRRRGYDTTPAKEQALSRLLGGASYRAVVGPGQRGGLIVHRVLERLACAPGQDAEVGADMQRLAVALGVRPGELDAVAAGEFGVGLADLDASARVVFRDWLRDEFMDGRTRG